MLQLEIQEGKVPMQGKEYAKDYGSGTSSLLRLTRYWSGSDRTVVADSAFASLKTAEALHKHRSLRFIGLVKTAHKRFPKAWLQKYPSTNGVTIVCSRPILMEGSTWLWDGMTRN